MELEIPEEYNAYNGYKHAKIPVCSICRHKFKKVGNKWEGTCPHHAGRVVEW